MASMKEVTIYDLANNLGVSASTISRALNNLPVVNEETRIKVNNLANQLGYRKNNFARNLRKKASYTIGVIIHELDSQFIISVLSGIEDVIAFSDYNLIIGHSDEKWDREKSNARNLFHKRVDGLIASLAYETEDLLHYDLFLQKGIPIVFFDRVEESIPGIKVIIDNQKAGYDAGMHLIDQGCKNMMHVTGNLSKNVYNDRLKGFRNALFQNNLELKPEMIVINELNEKAGIQVAEQILAMKNKPDGLFITRDLCAAICMQKLRELGFDCPRDIAVVGFNDDVISRVVQPKLTTIQYDGYEMGKVVARNLLQCLYNNTASIPDDIIVLGHKLIKRASSIKIESEELITL
jgi:LacI family transcriptional regulator